MKTGLMTGSTCQWRYRGCCSTSWVRRVLPIQSSSHFKSACISLWILLLLPLC